MRILKISKSENCGRIKLEKVSSGEALEAVFFVSLSTSSFPARREVVLGKNIGNIMCLFEQYGL